VDGEVMSPREVNEVEDVVVVQEENTKTQMGKGLRDKISSTMYKDFVTHVRKVKPLESSYA